MKVLRITFFIIFFGLINSLVAQDIAIPYRDGNKWGICNENGIFLLDPKYDKVEFIQGYDASQDALKIENNGKEGLFVEGKLLFEPEYDRIYQKDNLYFVSKFDNNKKTSDVIDSSGKSILKKPIIEVIYSKNFTSNILVFQVLNEDFTESLFFYDTKSNKILQTLYENYHSITFIREQSHYNSVSFLVKKEKNSPLTTEAWDVSKLPNQITKTKLLHRTKDEYLEKFLEKAYKEKGNDDFVDGESYGTGSGDGITVKEKIGVYDDVAIEAPYDENREVNKTVYLYHNFKISNEKLIVEKYNQNNPKNKIEIAIKSKIPLKNMEIKNYSFNTKSKDTINYYSNYIQYKNKEKTGLIFPSDINKTIEFDTISKTILSINDYSSNNRQIIFIVGNKDKKTNQFKYSLYSNLKGLLFPMQYDNLQYNPKLYAYNGNSNLLSRIGNKQGIVQIDGTEFLKAEYDEIIENNKYESYSTTAKKVLEIKKNNKYGYVFQDINNYKLQYVDAFFDYRIKDIFLNFPKLEYKKENVTNEKPKKITLISLKDERGNLVGYANDNGKLYFKD